MTYVACDVVALISTYKVNVSLGSLSQLWLIIRVSLLL